MNDTAAAFKIYRAEELSHILKLSITSVQSYLRKGRIKGVKIGREWGVSEKNLRAFLDGDTPAAAPTPAPTPAASPTPCKTAIIDLSHSKPHRVIRL